MLGLAPPARAAQDRAQPRQQLARLERLGQIIVGAHLQADHAVHGVAARGQHQDRRLRRLRAACGRRRARPCPAASGRGSPRRTARASCSAMPLAPVPARRSRESPPRRDSSTPSRRGGRRLRSAGCGRSRFQLKAGERGGGLRLGDNCGPHPNLSPGEGKEPRKQGHYACSKCLLSFWYVKFCKVGGGAVSDATPWPRAPRKSPVSGGRQEHGNRIGRYEAGPSTRAAQDARLPRTQGRQRRGPALAARRGAGPTPPRPCTKRL